MQKVEGLEARLWYAEQPIENGWSRSMLTTWIETDLYGRQGKTIHNFQSTLPEPQSDLAEQVLKDPYNFSFLALDKKYREQELEQGLIDHNRLSVEGKALEDTSPNEIDAMIARLKERAYNLK